MIGGGNEDVAALVTGLGYVMRAVRDDDAGESGQVGLVRGRADISQI